MGSGSGQLQMEDLYAIIDNIERDWKRAHSSIVTSRNMLVTARPLCKSVSYTIVQAPMALYSLVFNSNLTCSAIEQGIKL